MWIYDEKQREDSLRSLRTTNRIEALAKAEQLYREQKDALRRGVKLTSIDTHELVRLTKQKEGKPLPMSLIKVSLLIVLIPW